jgi:hypothetical protein
LFIITDCRVWGNGLFRDLQKYKWQLFCMILQGSYRDLTGILCIVIQGSCVGSYRDFWWGHTGILDGLYRIICGLWVLFSLNESVRMDCSEIYKNTNGNYSV